MTSVRRRRVGAVAALAACMVLAGTAWVIGSRVRSPAQAAARAAAPEPSWVTAPVEHRVLSSTVITRGDVEPEVSTAVAGPAAATTGSGSDGAGVVTGLFVAQGDEVAAGDRVLEVAGRPVFVFAGPTPAYRTLRPGMTGADVAQLQAGLTAGGCDAGDSGTYDEATKTCVEQLYADAGYATVRGSDSELADLADAERTLDTARSDLATAENALARATRPAAAADVSSARAAVDDAERAHDAALRDQPVLIAAATAKVDDALAALNAVLAGADPATASPGPSAADGRAVGGGAEAGDAGDGGGVAGRNAAWAALGTAVDGVEQARHDSADDAATTASAMQAASDALAAVQGPPDISAEQLAVDQQRHAVRRAVDDLSVLQAVSGAVVPFGEVVFVPELLARVDAVAATVGAAGAGQGPDGKGSGSLVVLASPTLHAEVAIPQTALALVREGAPVELLDEASGDTVAGTVTSIGDHVETSPASGQPGYPAVVDADLPEAWSGRNVRVTFTTASTDHEVLVVPSAAVSSAADGTTRVQVERSDGTIVTVDVTTGLSADGYVEASPAADVSLQEGDRVVIGR